MAEPLPLTAALRAILAHLDFGTPPSRELLQLARESLAFHDPVPLYPITGAASYWLGDFGAVALTPDRWPDFDNDA